MFEISGLQVSYGQSEVIHKVNFSAKKMKPWLSWAVTAWEKLRCSRR